MYIQAYIQVVYTTHNVWHNTSGIKANTDKTKLNAEKREGSCRDRSTDSDENIVELHDPVSAGNGRGKSSVVYNLEHSLHWCEMMWIWTYPPTLIFVDPHFPKEMQLHFRHGSLDIQDEIG